jgi:hypothetical protein
MGASAGFGDHSRVLRSSGRYALVIGGQIVALMVDQSGDRRYMDSASWVVVAAKPAELGRTLTEREINNPDLLYHYRILIKRLRDAKVEALKVFGLEA